MTFWAGLERDAAVTFAPQRDCTVTFEAHQHELNQALDLTAGRAVD
jgi:hypothetical protein